MAFWDPWLDAIAEWISRNGWNNLPQATLFISLTSVFIALLSTSLTKLLVDTESLNETMQRVNGWNQRRKKAMAKADKKLWLSVKREEDGIKKLQQSMMMKRMKPMLFTFIPFMLIFAILRRAFADHYFAWLPFNLGGFPFLGKNAWSELYNYRIPSGLVVKFSKISFTFWYFLSSFAFGSLISRIFGTNPQGAVVKKEKPKPKSMKSTQSNKSKPKSKSKTKSKSTKN